MNKFLLPCLFSLLFLLSLTVLSQPTYALPEWELKWSAFVNRESLLISAEELQVFESAIEKLLTEGLQLTTEGQLYTFPAQAKDVLLQKEKDRLSLTLDPEFWDYILTTTYELTNIPSQNIRLLEVDSTKVGKTRLEEKIVDGKELVPDLTKILIEEALQKGETKAQMVTRVIEGRVLNETGEDLGPLELLAMGRSNFTGSSEQRAFNVQKALNEHFNGILIPPQAEFSYLEFLGSVTNSAGWKNAISIFKVNELNWVPGGGICQVSTTVYRAALDAGLTITEQRNHSLYIAFYDDYGDGLDATVFPGEQDFKFINNTENYLLLLAQEEGNQDAVIRFYGEDDGRKTELFGPYTQSNQTGELTQALGILGIGQMAWKYQITWGDGRVEEKWLLSDYHSLVRQYY